MRSENSNIQIKQELVNSIVHGFGIILPVSIPIPIALAIKSENMAGIVGAAVYGFCFLQLFTFLHFTMEQHTQAKTHLKP
jgi:hemolysin III